MLRNIIKFARAVRFVFLLNEVLSLNAQEFAFVLLVLSAVAFLNEVLSLNAQELNDDDNAE